MPGGRSSVDQNGTCESRRENAHGWRLKIEAAPNGPFPSLAAIGRSILEYVRIGRSKSLSTFAKMATLLTLATIAPFADSAPLQSTCYGTPALGRIENAVRLPLEGRNFSAYSSLAATLGRTYVHSRVRDAVVEAYARLEQTAPGSVFVYGETGWAAGGSFAPHRTHQNGLSVDFLVPVLDPGGRSVPLPTSAANRYGYDIEFDTAGRWGNYRIDFEALAEHLHQLHAAAAAQGVDIARVIFDPVLQVKLFRTRRGADLRRKMTFMKTQAWIRHDEHYHVDFAVKCRRLPS